MMALSLVSGAAYGFFGSTVPSWDPKPWTTNEISSKEGLVSLAEQLNPIVGYFDPLEIGESDRERIAWFRHAEIKHGRVAMAAFVGFLVQNSGIYFPGALQMPLKPSFKFENCDLITFGDISAAGGPADQWDSLPTGAKVQILLFVGALELWGESTAALEADGQQHYVRGGKPGYYPSFKSSLLPLNLFDPLKLQSKMSPQRKETARLAEINNGRLAMLGIIGLLSASKGLIVPGLDSLALKPYAGEIMAPFTSINSDLPFVEGMLAIKPF